MGQAAPPVLTVRYDGSQRTFAPGHDVVVGRDLRADMRITHPLISRAHLLLRYDQGRWLAIDNGSLNGTFVNGRRVPVVDIHDGQSINIGNPDGPRLTFEVGRHQGLAGRPPQTASMRAVQPSAAPPRLAPPRPADSPAGRGHRSPRRCGRTPAHLRLHRRARRCIRPAGSVHPRIPAAVGSHPPMRAVHRNRPRLRPHRRPRWPRPPPSRRKCRTWRPR